VSRKYKLNDLDQLYFVTIAGVNWIDLFIRKGIVSYLSAGHENSTSFGSAAFSRQKRGTARAQKNFSSPQQLSPDIQNVINSLP